METRFEPTLQRQFPNGLLLHEENDWRGWESRTLLRRIRGAERQNPRTRGRALRRSRCLQARRPHRSTHYPANATRCSSLWLADDQTKAAGTASEARYSWSWHHFCSTGNHQQNLNWASKALPA